MSAIPPQDTPLGALGIDRVFIEYDGPKLFSCKSSHGLIFLCLLIEEDDEEDTETYLYVPVDQYRYEAFLSGVVTGREAFSASSSQVWLLTQPFGDGPTKTVETFVSEIDTSRLPDGDTRLNIQNCRSGSEDGDRSFGDSAAAQLVVSGLTEVSAYRSTPLSFELWVEEESAWEKTTSTFAPREVLSRLASAWPHLLWEERFQGETPVSALNDLRKSIQRALPKLPDKRRNEELASYEEFLHNHELSDIFGLSGVGPAAIAREGKFGWILRADAYTKSSIVALLDMLEQFGSTLCGALSGSPEADDLPAIESWRRRHLQEPMAIAHIATGIQAEQLAQIEQTVGDAELWSSSTQRPEGSEILAAARMTASLPPDEVAQVILLIRAFPRQDTPELDELTSKAMQQVTLSEYAFDQGLDVARWLRSELGFKPTDRVDPKDVLEKLGVAVGEEKLVEGLDAVCAWGDEYGPCVLVDTAGSRSENRRRISYAHELGHLLMDREGALPVGDVLTGQSTGSIEARARAFAVEFLLPQQTAASEFGASSRSTLSSAKWLSKRFGVSTEVVAWNIRNSGMYLSPDTEVELRSLVSMPWRF